jgi:hypothetical protein
MGAADRLEHLERGGRDLAADAVAGITAIA